jgi:ATP-binding cassette subfamily B protein RaxB
VLYRPLHQTTEESILNKAKEQSNFLENVRGIQTIKLFGNESQRQSIWLNRYAEVVNADIRLGKLNISFVALHKLLFSFENIIVIYIGSMIFMNGGISVGMLLAFIAYKLQFTERVSNLIEQLIEFRMMRLHLERIADIALSAAEANRDGEYLTAPVPVKGRLTLENICFRFSESDPYIISNLNLDIEPGDCVAITGASGSGKTTLVKIMLGLLQPASGTVRIDGHDITKLGLKNYRKKVAAVMQNDTLLAGSIADNIAFFEPEPNYLKIEKCARLASIHEDIVKMPMGYNALVGDMGSNLSGGQIQRLILARALYQQPMILFMDEATSHLDLENELKIANQVQNLEVTRIIIAHRPETIKKANRVYHLMEGKLELTMEKSVCNVV